MLYIFGRYDEETELTIEGKEAEEGERTPDSFSRFYAKGALQYIMPILHVTLASPDTLRSQIGNPSTNSLDALKVWEGAAAVGWMEKRCIVLLGRTEIALKRENQFPKGITDKSSNKVVLKHEI